MRKNTFHLVACAVIVCALVVSLACFLPSAARRHVLVFPSAASGDRVVEVRYAPRQPVQGSIPRFVDELLLGPQSRRARPLFVLGTRAEFCFLRGKTLYLGLSKELLAADAVADDMLGDIALFKENIRKNFSRLDDIVLFVDGKYVE